jgi:YD repeat-containing protein
VIIELELVVGEGVTRRASCDAKGAVTVRDPDGTTIAVARWADGKLGEKRILKGAVTRGQWGQIEGRLIVAARHARTRDLKQSGDYLNFVIDPDGDEPPTPIGEGVKLTPGVWKVRVDRSGTLVITALRGEHLVIVATATWSDVKISAKQIKNGSVSKEQWAHVHAAIVAAWKERVRDAEERRIAKAREAATGSPYVTFLLDLADCDDDRLIEGTLSSVPNADPPTGPFVWKVACTTEGVVQIWSLGMKLEGSAKWTGALVERWQPTPLVPTAYQWSLVEQALALAFERREEVPGDATPTQVDEAFALPSIPDPSFRAFLLDIRDGSVVEGSVRFAPDPELVPERVFVWEVTLFGTTVRIEDRDGDRLATGTWEGGLVDTAQAGSIPTDAQWAFVRTALHRVAGIPEVTPDPPRAARSSSIEEKRANRPVPDSPPRGQSRRRARGGRITWQKALVVWGAIVATVIVVAVVVAARSRERVNRKQDAVATPSKTEVSRAPAPVIAPRAPVAPPQTPTDTFATRLAEHRLRWADVAVPPETTIEQAEKEPVDEKGKRLCVEGTVDSITRADQGARRLYNGAITTKSGDRVTFLVGGTTGAIVKRSEVTLCGVVTGFADGAVALEGMFDLPENRNPIVEKD